MKKPDCDGYALDLSRKGTRTATLGKRGTGSIVSPRRGEDRRPS